MRRYNLVVRALLPSYRRHIRLAKSSGRFDQRIQHRPQIECRAADDLEHVGGGGLLLQRFAQLVEQPRILDRDDGLCCKVAHRSTCLSVNRRTSWRKMLIAPIGSSSLSIGTHTTVR